MPLTPQQQVKQIQQLSKNLQRDPVGIFGVIGDVYWSMQAVIIRAVFKHRKVCVKTCHGVGKSWLASRILFAWMLAYPWKCLVLTTAPTFRQVKKIIWREIRSAFEKSKTPMGGKMLKTEYQMGADVSAFGFSADNSDAAQGIHEENLLAIVDEAGGVDKEVRTGIDAISTASHNHILLIGNPTDPAGHFADAFKSSVYKKISISAFVTPNFKYNKIKTPEQLAEMTQREVEALPLPCPYLITPIWVWEKIEEWGIGSSIFQVRVMAEFPIEGDDILIPYNLCEKSMALDESEFVYTKNKKVIGIDVARYGDNATVLIGVDQHKMLDLVRFIGKDTMKTVVAAIKLFRELGMNKSLDMFVVDDTGVGGGVTDRLRELGYNVKAVNFGGKPSKEYPKGDICPVNTKAEMCWNAMKVIKGGEFKLLDIGKLLSQLPNIRYNITTNDKLEILSKDKMTKLGYKSPDDADAFVLALWGLRVGGGFGAAVGGSVVGAVRNKTF